MADLTLKAGIDITDFQNGINQMKNAMGSLVQNGNAPNLVNQSFSAAVVNPYQNIQTNRFANNNPLFNNQFRESANTTSTSIKKLGEMSTKFIQSLADANDAISIFSKNLRNGTTGNGSDREDLSGKRKKDENEKPLKDVRSAESLINIVEKVTNLISNASKGQLAYTQRAVTGDIIGANFAKRDSEISMLKNGGALLAGIGALIGGPIGMALGSVVGGGLAIGGTIWDMFTDRQKENHAYSEEYRKALPQMTSLGTAFGGENVAKKSYSENAKDELNNWYNLTSKYNKNTGMDNAAFTQLASNFAQYGVTNIDNAGSMANLAARWQRFAGGNANEYADFMGKMTRYGSLNAENDVGYAYSAAKNSGLTKGQFPEFLRGLQQVIENGISKGYVKSTKDVSDTLSMFGKMSGGNIAWTGTQGVQKMLSMNEGLANATALSDPSHLIAYQALKNQKADIKATGKKNGWYNEKFNAYNALAYMESGVDVNKIRNVYSGIKNTYAGDEYQKIEAVKKIFGLNNIGAMQFMNYAENGLYSDALKAYDNVDNKNNETKLQDALSKINTSVVALGKEHFDKELKTISDYAGNILDELKSHWGKNTEVISKVNAADAKSIMGSEAEKNSLAKMNEIAATNDRDKYIAEYTNSWIITNQDRYKRAQKKGYSLPEFKDGDSVDKFLLGFDKSLTDWEMEHPDYSEIKTKYNIRNASYGWGKNKRNGLAISTNYQEIKPEEFIDLLMTQEGVLDNEESSRRVLGKYKNQLTTYKGDNNILGFGGWLSTLKNASNSNGGIDDIEFKEILKKLNSAIEKLAKKDNDFEKVVIKQEIHQSNN